MTTPPKPHACQLTTMFDEFTFYPGDEVRIKRMEVFSICDDTGKVARIERVDIASDGTRFYRLGVSSPGAALWQTGQSLELVTPCELRVKLQEAEKSKNVDRFAVGYTLVERGDVAEFEFCYPRNGDTQIKKLEVGLMDVRSADNIRISYDFARDGWSVEQASTFQWETDDKVCDPGWQEVAFVQAWGLKSDYE